MPKKQQDIFWVLQNCADEKCYVHYGQDINGENNPIDCWGDVMTAEHYDSEDEAREDMLSLLHVYGIEAEPHRVTVDITIE